MSSTLGEWLPAAMLIAFGVVMAVPFVYGGFRTAMAGLRGVVLMSRRAWQARTPLRTAALVTRPPRMDLSPRMRRFAHMTRELIAAVDWASQRSTGWRDGTPASVLRRVLALLGRDEEYRPTIGVTGEVWGWLQDAEAIADSGDLDAEEVGRLAAHVRELLFAEGAVGPRLSRIVEHLVRADAGFRAEASDPYRGTMPGTAVCPAAEFGDDEGSETNERLHRSYDETVEAHHQAIAGVARRYARDEGSVDDLIQEIRLAVWKALDRFRGEASVKTYVLRIAHYRGVSFARRRRHHAPVGDLADPGPGPAEQLDDARRRVAVAEAIAELPQGQREAITLLLEGLSYREIGERLGISAGTTSARITRARQSLRHRLADS